MNNKNLILKAGKPAPAIDWSLVDSLPLADTPDEDSPELSAKDFSSLRPVAELLPDFNDGFKNDTISIY